MPDATDVEHNSCAERKADRPDRRIGLVADGQHGVIARAQLKALGLSDREVGYRLELGRLQLLHRSVYAVGHGRLSKEARWTAAVLAGGGGERDRLLQVAGWRPVRVTWRQLHGSPQRLARDLQRLLSATTLAA